MKYNHLVMNLIILHDAHNVIIVLRKLRGKRQSTELNSVAYQQGF